MTSDSVIFGIDGGGTGCRAALCRADGTRLADGESGAANIMTNLDTSRENIIDACLRALNKVGLSDDSLLQASAYLGVAGANVGSYAVDIAKALPFARCEVTTDAQISLQGAIGNGDGVVAIIGTGSVFISRFDDEVRTAGGWGFVVGDLGSGARVGRELLQEALLAHDGVRLATPITAHILNDFRNNPQTIVEYAHSASPGDFGRFAPLVLEYVQQEDITALRIWDRAIRSVEEALASIIGDRQARLCLLGGFGKRYGDYLSDRFTGMIVQPKGSGLDGAVDLALHRFSPQFSTGRV
jgi:glucosamine kinase